MTQNLHFWTNIDSVSRKTKNIAGKQKLWRDYRLRANKEHKFNVTQKSWKIRKIRQKPSFFEPKMSLNCPLGQSQNVNQDSHIHCNIKVFPELPHTKFQSLDIAWLHFTRDILLNVFVLDQINSFWTISSSNLDRYGLIKLKIWPCFFLIAL